MTMSNQPLKETCPEREGGAVWRFVLLVEPAPEPAQVRVLGKGAVLLPEPGAPAARVRFDRPASTFAQAIVAGVRAAEQVGLRALRVDLDDWVTAADVACRVGKCRETVRLWVTGRLGPGGFPPPANPRRETTYYSWAEVLPWLRERAGLELPEEEPALVAANMAVQLRALMPRVQDFRLLADLLDK